MKYNEMTYLDLLNTRQEINQAIKEYDDRQKIEVFSVREYGESKHYESVTEAANNAIEAIKSCLEDKNDLIALFNSGLELKTTKFTQAEVDSFVHVSSNK